MAKLQAFTSYIFNKEQYLYILFKTINAVNVVPVGIQGQSNFSCNVRAKRDWQV